MPFNAPLHHRKSTRLKGWDYSNPGIYFVTLCVQDRACLFGEIIDGKMVTTDAGRYAKKCWTDIPSHFPAVELDEFVIMPNHIHGILMLRDVGANNHSPDHTPDNHKSLVRQSIAGANINSPLRNHTKTSGTSKTIGSIIRGFKIGVTKWFRGVVPDGMVWQRNYYDHIGRDEKELFRIRHYIRNNPLNWESDEENPCGKSPRYVAMLDPRRHYL
jgi:putative transposase